MKINYIKNLNKGDSFESVAILKDIQTKQAKNGSEFLVVNFSDKSGDCVFMIFIDNALYNVLRNSKSGEIFRIAGMADFYNDKPSPRLQFAEKLSGEEIARYREELCATSEFDPATMKDELFAIINSIDETPLRNTVLIAIENAGDNFFTSTAAKAMHHAFIHGLLEHTLSCAKCANALLPLYPFIDRNMVLAGIILHDIGKIDEYLQDLTFNKSRSGILQGHMITSYRRARKAAIKANLDQDSMERLEHIILSHHGELEWGAVVIPATPEAVFVSGIDNFDAKMGAVSGILKNENSEFSDMSYALKSKLLTTKRNIERDEK